MTSLSLIRPIQLTGRLFSNQGKQKSMKTTPDLFESLNKSGMWAAINRSGNTLQLRMMEIIYYCFDILS